MKVLHIILERKAVEKLRQVFELVKFLEKNDCYCRIVCPEFETKDFEKDIVKIDYLSQNSIYKIFKTAERIIQSEEIDVIHVHCCLGAWLAFWLCQKYKKKFIQTCYDFYPQNNIFYYSLNLSKRIIVHRYILGSYFTDVLGIDFQKVQFIPELLDASNIKFESFDSRSKTDFIIGMVSPNFLEKEYEIFLMAMAKVVRIIPNLKIRIIRYLGDDEHSFVESITNLIRQFGLNNFVQISDFLYPIERVFSDLNLLVSPLIKENAHTRYILEAQARGIVVIGSMIGGISEFIQNRKNGLLVSPGDSAELANTIVNSLKDYALLRNIAIESRKGIEQNFDINKNIGKVIEQYQQVKKRNNILVLVTGNSDCVTASMGCFYLLRKRFPDSYISCLLDSKYRKLFEGYSYIDQVTVIEQDRLFVFLEWFKLLRIIFKRNFDFLVDLTDSNWTRLFSFFSMIPIRCVSKLNFGFLRNFRRRDIKEEKSLLERNYRILSLLGIKDRIDSEFWNSFFKQDFIKKFFEENWLSGSRLIGIDISGIEDYFWKNKITENVAFLCDRLAKRHARVVVASLAKNRNIEYTMKRLVKSKPVIVLGEFSIIQMISLLKKFDAYYSFSQENLDIAKSIGVPERLLLSKKNIYDFASGNKKATSSFESVSKMITTDTTKQLF